MMQLFVDDSGRSDPPVFVLAGYIATPETWAKFTARWNALLHAAPAIRYFKMKEAFALKGEFASFTTIERDHKLASLGRVCAELLNAGISVVARHDDWREVFHGAVSPGLDTPYFLLCHMITIAAVEWQNRAAIIQPIELNFDQQLGESEAVQKHFATIIARGDATINSRLVGPPNYLNDQEAVPLQAADLLAWHQRRLYSDKANGRPGTWTAAWPFIERIDVHMINFDRARMEATLALFREELQAEEKLFPHDARNFRENADGVVSMVNLRRMGGVAAGKEVELLTIMDKRMRRFVLVDSCLDVGSPHLHRRAGGGCLPASSMCSLQPAEQT